MGFWDGKAANVSWLRYFEPTQGWRAHDDVKDANGHTTAPGSCREIELALHTALNTSNLVVLTGAGSSYCARTPGGDDAPSMADLWNAVETEVTPAGLAQIVSLIPSAAKVDKNIEKLLTLCKLYSELFEDQNAKKISDFVIKAEKAIVRRVNFVLENTDLSSHRNLIRKLARRSTRKSRAKIFTTNYDLCFEYAARDQQFVVTDGFSHSTPQSYDRAHFSYDIIRRESDSEGPQYIENVFHLYKMHGSIDWRRRGTGIIRSPDVTIGDPLLIYPRDSKYQEAFDSPFLDLIGAFQSALREPDTALVISGFGFVDDHISKPIMAAIEANLSLRVIVCDVCFLSDASLTGNDHVIPTNASARVTTNVYFNTLRKLVEIGDQRVSVLNGRFEDLALAIPDLVAQTEREQHLERLQKLRQPSSGVSNP